MRIYCVCGAGIGTSVIMARLVEKALAELQIQATVEAVALGEVGARSPAQLILATEDVVGSLQTRRSQVVVIKSVTDLNEIRQALTQALG